MSLPRYRPVRRLRPLGRRAARVRPVRRVEYAAVAVRARGRCELCGYSWEEITGRSLSPHHTFGRGHLPGIPQAICETRELILGLCMNWPLAGHHGCHERIHAGDVHLGDAARRMAIGLFANRHALSYRGWPWEDPLEVMRELVRLLEGRTR